MACYGNVNVQLGATGTVALTPEMLLFEPPAECLPNAIISPSTLTCADVGMPVFVTITDPVGGNSCWSNVTVNDPEPSDCEIIAPGTIFCGDVSVPLSVNVVGGSGTYTYDWQIKGNPFGWLEKKHFRCQCNRSGSSQLYVNITIAGHCTNYISDTYSTKATITCFKTRDRI